MKKKVIIILGVFFVLVVGCMGYISVKKLGRKKDIQNKQSDLALMLNQLGQTESDIKPSTILLFFNSECEHCQWEMEEISNKINEFDQHQLLLVSFEPEQEAIAFLKHYNLSNHYVRSSPEKVIASFSGGVPQTLIYKEGKLVKHFNGEVKIEAILDSIK